MANTINITLSLPEQEGLQISLTDPMSVTDFEQFCAANPDIRAERSADGKVWIMAPVNLESGYYEGEVFGELRNYCLRTRNGKAFSPSTGFQLPDGSTRAADASWVSNEQLSQLTQAQRQTFPPIVPDFVIEIRSKTDARSALEQKMQETWIANGVQLAWLIDPQTQQVVVYRPGSAPLVMDGFNRTISASPLLQGFEFDLRLLEF
jgi:Uma2 family endonuclease